MRPDRIKAVERCTGHPLNAPWRSSRAPGCARRAGAGSVLAGSAPQRDVRALNGSGAAPIPAGGLLEALQDAVALATATG
jgi:hypothetical protein